MGYLIWHFDQILKNMLLTGKGDTYMIQLGYR